MLDARLPLHDVRRQVLCVLEAEIPVGHLAELGHLLDPGADLVQRDDRVRAQVTVVVLVKTHLFKSLALFKLEL